MNIKRELIATAVRILADNSSLVRKPDSFETFLTDFFGAESYDQKLARQIDEESQRVAAATKRAVTNHKFKKLTKNF